MPNRDVTCCLARAIWSVLSKRREVISKLDFHNDYSEWKGE